MSLRSGLFNLPILLSMVAFPGVPGWAGAGRILGSSWNFGGVFPGV